MGTQEKILENVSKQWGWVAVRGVAALVFGVMCFFWPAASILALIVVWGIYALVDGVSALIAGFSIRDNGKPLWAVVIIGLVGLIAGGFALLWPGVTAVLFMVMLGTWALFAGAFQIIAAVRMRKEIENEWLMVLSGLCLLILGAAAIWQPMVGLVTSVLLVGIFSTIIGCLNIGLALRLRKYRG